MCAAVWLVAAILLPAAFLCAQVETVESPPTAALWVSHSRLEGHLALKYSSDGAFSPDASLLAVVAGDKVLLMNLRTDTIQKVLKPHLPDIEDLEIHSANFLSPHQLFLLANGVFHVKGKQAASTPLLAFQWDIDGDHVEGKVNAVGSKGGFSPARYFPMIGYLALYKESNFDLWNPRIEPGRHGQHPRPDPDSQSLRDFSGRPLAAAGADSDHFGRGPLRGGIENPQVCGCAARP